MAVNVGQRNVKDTDSNKVLNACTEAVNLYLYTFDICKNENVFLPKYSIITDDIIKMSKDIYVKAWMANNIKVGNNASLWNRRFLLQE